MLLPFLEKEVCHFSLFQKQTVQKATEIHMRYCFVCDSASMCFETYLSQLSSKVFFLCGCRVGKQKVDKGFRCQTHTFGVLLHWQPLLMPFPEDREKLMHTTLLASSYLSDTSFRQGFFRGTMRRCRCGVLIPVAIHTDNDKEYPGYCCTTPGWNCGLPWLFAI